MNETQLGEILSKFNCNPPTSPKLIAEFENLSRLQLPRDYARFLEFSNGGEGFVGPNSYAILWRVEELLPLNEAYQLKEYAPGLLAFGSDGGGEAFAFDARSHVVSVPFVGLSVDLANGIAQTFDEFLKVLSDA